MDERLSQPVAGAVLRGARVHGPCVRLIWSDGFEAEFAAAWLLDNAPPAQAPTSGQRLRTARSLALAGPIAGATVAEDVVRLEFAEETVEWPGARLRACALAGPAAMEEISLWSSGSDIAARPPIACPDYLADNAALQSALSDAASFGLARLTGAGLDEAALERVVQRFGFIRETNYGRLFEVRVVPDPGNLADTARALEPHTDNPYRDPTPTLQLLHCIRNAGEGGATFFLDGFALAEWFREAHPDHFARLAGRAVPFSFTTAAGERYQALSPVIRLSVDGRIAGIRFNHRALGSVDPGAADTARWYDAYLAFAMEADAPARRLSLHMAPGDIVIFDNERILHGREAFSSAANRLLKGCYADRDGLRATLARLGIGE